MSPLNLEPGIPIACDRIVMNLRGNLYIGLTNIRIIAEVGQEKTVLLPFLNTTEDMEYVNNGYNDDGTFNTAGSEQLRILRRGGCSTAIYHQLGETTNGLQF